MLKPTYDQKSENFYGLTDYYVCSDYQKTTC